MHPWHVVLLNWTANSFGIAITAVAYLYILPLPPIAQSVDVVRQNLLVGGLYTGLTYVVVALVSVPQTHRALDWTVRGAEPTPDEQLRTLKLPWFLFKMSAAMPRLGRDQGLSHQLFEPHAGSLAVAVL